MIDALIETVSINYDRPHDWKASRVQSLIQSRVVRLISAIITITLRFSSRVFSAHKNTLFGFVSAILIYEEFMRECGLITRGMNAMNAKNVINEPGTELIFVLFVTDCGLSCGSAISYRLRPSPHIGFCARVFWKFCMNKGVVE